MRVINLFAGPGAGKSTTAAALFAHMKYDGISVELVTEYAKDKVWEKSFQVLENQIYVFGKQHHRIFRLREQVEWVVTDSPMLLSLYYGEGVGKPFRDLVLQEHERFPTVNIFLERVKPYVAQGRRQSEESARGIDREIRSILDRHLVRYFLIPGDEDAPRKIRSAIKAQGLFFNADLH